MIPWMVTFDHTNYTKWGITFLIDMQQLESFAPEVYAGFMDSNFVVNESGHKLNQISDDLCLEHFS